MTKTAVAAAYGVDRNTISRWLNKFEEGGDEALHRQPGSGRPRRLEDLTEEELLRIVLAGAESYGFETDLWTVGRLRRVIVDEFQIQVSKNTINTLAVWSRTADLGGLLTFRSRGFGGLPNSVRHVYCEAIFLDITNRGCAE